MELPKNIKINAVIPHTKGKSLKGDHLAPKTKNLPKNIDNVSKPTKSKAKKKKK